MSLNALHLGQIISTVLGTPNMRLSPYCYLLNPKSFSLSDVLILFSDGAFRDGEWEVR